MASDADIVIYGGHSGGGKSFALLMEPLRHANNPQFGAVIFRRKLTQVTNEGGLWDTAMAMYQPLGAHFRGEPKLDFTFPSGSKVGFAHLIMEETVYDWHSAQIPLLGFDELTQFTRKQFFYLLTRNRSTCGVKPYVRATTNPDADSWVAEFIGWWWDPETGYAIPERSGVIRWMFKIDEEINWFDSYDEAITWREDQPELPDDLEPKSVTFIEARLEDNRALLEKDPSYKANLYAQDRITRERLIGGNWKIRATGGKFFKREDFEIVDDYPRDYRRRVRYWDFAGTEAKKSKSKTKQAEKLVNDPDWTCGLDALIDKNGIIYLVDLVRERVSPGGVEKLVRRTAEADGKSVPIWMEQEPGSSGKFVIDNFRRKVLLGYTVKPDKPTGSKLTRAEPYQAYAEAGNIKLVRGEWNNIFLSEHEAFPDPKIHDDTVDVGSGAFKALTSGAIINIG